MRLTTRQKFRRRRYLRAIYRAALRAGATFTGKRGRSSERAVMPAKAAGAVERAASRYRFITNGYKPWNKI